ncbi:substrate-binding domain-containing protein [Methylobacterium sp. JK268]
MVRVPRSSVRQIESLGGPAGTACTAPACEGQSDSGRPLRIAGSNTVGAELMPNLLEAYARRLGAEDVQWLDGRTPEDRSMTARGAAGTVLTAELAAHGSGTAPPALADGQADLGMMSREINKEELAKTAAAGLGDLSAPAQQHVVALDGLLVLVNRDNPVGRLTLDAIAAIFAGETTDWAAVGGHPGPITIYRRADKSGTLDTFMALVMKKRKISSAAQAFESSSDLSDAVAADRNGIGFVGIAYARNAKPVEIALECGLGYAPSEFLVRTEEYPLSRRLFLYAGARPTHPRVPDFIDYALSEKAQPIITRNQFIDLMIVESEASYGDRRISEAARDPASDRVLLGRFARDLSGAARLSVTYRFRSAGADLDSKAVRDIDRLAALLKEPRNRDRRVMILGYADSRGTTPRKIALSERRAATVMQELVARGVPPRQLAARGLGSFAPVACDGSAEAPNEDGLRKNRRVEVWMR